MLSDPPFAPETVDEQLSDQQSPRRLASRSSRKMLRSVLLVVLIGVVLAGLIFLPSLYVAFFSARPGSIAGSLPHPGSSTVANGLAMHPGPQLFFYRGNIYVDIAGETHVYSARNGVPGRADALANLLVGNSTIVDGILYESRGDSTTATRLSDGTLLWRAPFNSGNLNAQEIENGVLYGMSEGTFYSMSEGREQFTHYESISALRASDGKLLWRHRLKTPPEFALQWSVVVLQGVLYFTSIVVVPPAVDERITALKATDGTLLWSHTLGQTLLSSAHPGAIFAPGTNGSLLYVDVNSSLMALQPGSGKVMWQTPLSVRPLITSDIVYAARGDTVYALQAARGTVLWRSKPGTNGQISRLFGAAGSVLAIGLFAEAPAGNQAVSSIVGLRTSDGHLLWQYPLHGYGAQTPFVIVGPAAVYGALTRMRGLPGADLFALRAADGIVLWQQKVS